MTTKDAFAIIDKSTLESCLIMLTIAAPNMADKLELLMASDMDQQSLLATARDFVRQQYLLETN